MPLTKKNSINDDQQCLKFQKVLKETNYTKDHIEENQLEKIVIEKEQDVNEESQDDFLMIRKR